MCLFTRPFYLHFFLEGHLGFEPKSSGLTGRRSTVELMTPFTLVYVCQDLLEIHVIVF